MNNPPRPLPPGQKKKYPRGSELESVFKEYSLATPDIKTPDRKTPDIKTPDVNTEKSKFRG